jgi:hypothetical protein
MRTETELVLCALAAWRVTHLLVAEDGPADIVVRLRIKLGEHVLGSMMDCFYCASFWVAMPFAFVVAHDALEWVVSWLAISGAAALFERMSLKKGE